MTLIVQLIPVLRVMVSGKLMPKNLLWGNLYLIFCVCVATFLITKFFTNSPPGSLLKINYFSITQFARVLLACLFHNLVIFLFYHSVLTSLSISHPLQSFFIPASPFKAGAATIQSKSCDSFIPCENLNWGVYNTDK